MRRATGFMIFCCFAVSVRAQNNTSPYSMIGIGDLEKSSFDRSAGMGYAGMALSSSRFFYQANPAAFAKIDEHFFYAEVATRFKSVSYSGIPITDPASSSSTDMQFKKIAIAIKPRSKWALSIGLLPYSTSNYSFTATKSIQGSNLTTDAYYQGSGSTNQFYVTNAFTLAKNLYVGLQTSYIFGQLQETETIASTIADSILVTNRNIFLGSPNFKLGLQYKFNINKQLELAMGATASNQTRMRADYALQVKDGNSVVLNNASYKTNYFTLPATYTGGLAAIWQKSWTLAFDYQYQGWGSLQYKGINYSLVNSQRYSGGTEYSKKLSYMNQSIEKYFLQGGFYYSHSYLQMAGQQLNEYGVTLGAGVQLARSGFGLQGAIDFGMRGTTDYGLIKEKFTQFNVTLSYRDFWLSRKMKKYD